MFSFMTFCDVRVTIYKITSILQRVFRTKIMLGNGQLHHKHGIFQVTTPWGFCSGSSQRVLLLLLVKGSVRLFPFAVRELLPQFKWGNILSYQGEMTKETNTVLSNCFVIKLFCLWIKCTFYFRCILVWVHRFSQKHCVRADQYSDQTLSVSINLLLLNGVALLTSDLYSLVVIYWTFSPNGCNNWAVWCPNWCTQ